jgi:hypothetical protein
MSCFNPRALTCGFAVAFAPLLLRVGCVYALRPAIPSSQALIRVVQTEPATVVLRLHTPEPREFWASADGRAIIDVPSYRPPCKIYLLGTIGIPSELGLHSGRNIDVVVGGKISRRLSLEQLAALPSDSEGYHLVTIRTLK